MDEEREEGEDESKKAKPKRGFTLIFDGAAAACIATGD